MIRSRAAGESIGFSNPRGSFFLTSPAETEAESDNLDEQDGGDLSNIGITLNENTIEECFGITVILKELSTGLLISQHFLSNADRDRFNNLIKSFEAVSRLSFTAAEIAPLMTGISEFCEFLSSAAENNSFPKGQNPADSEHPLYNYFRQFEATSDSLKKVHTLEQTILRLSYYTSNVIALEDEKSISELVQTGFKFLAENPVVPEDIVFQFLELLKLLIPKLSDKHRNDALKGFLAGKNLPHNYIFNI